MEKKEIASAAIGLAAVVYLILYLIPNLIANAFIAVVTLALLGYGIFNIVIWAFVTDVIDYHDI